MKEKLSAFYAKDSTQKVVASLLSILIGLVVGSLVILIVGLTSKSISTKGAGASPPRAAATCASARPRSL